MMLIFQSIYLHFVSLRPAVRRHYLVSSLAFLYSLDVSARGLETLSENVEEVSKIESSSSPSPSADKSVDGMPKSIAEPVKVETIRSGAIIDNTSKIPATSNKSSDKNPVSEKPPSNLEKNYQAGFNLGFQSVKSTAGKLESTTGFGVFATKRVPLFDDSLTSRAIVGYQPITGSLRVNERDHDLTSHGFTGGIVADYSPEKAALDLRFSAQIAYFLTFARADDGLEVESRSKLNGAAFLVNSSALWRLSSGTKLGPQITLAGGQFSWINLGISSFIEF